MLAMANPGDPATKQIQEKLKHLYDAVHQIEAQRVDNQETLDKITKTHKKVSSDGRISTYYQQKLKSLYTVAISEGSEESNKLREALDTINEIREIVHGHRIQSRNTGSKDTFRRGAHMKMLQIYAQTLPLWIGEGFESPPPLCAAIPAESNYIANQGDMVAALVKGIEEEENWILAEVVSYSTLSGKYEVDDIDEGQKERYLLSRRKVIPLPLMRANPLTEPEALFPKDSIVLALYPQTTCFYKAIVSSLPTTAAGEYEVLFEDSSYPSGYAPPLNVAQRYVISYKEIKKKNMQIV